MPPREVAATKAAPEEGEHHSDDGEVCTEDQEASEGEGDEGTGDGNETATITTTTSNLGPCTLQHTFEPFVGSSYLVVGYGIQFIP